MSFNTQAPAPSSDHDAWSGRRAHRRKTRRILLIGALGLMAAVVALWLYPVIRVQFARPVISRDFWREANAQRRAPEGAIAAWPLYQSLGIQLQSDKSLLAKLDVLVDGPQGPQWHVVAPLIANQRELVDAIHEASSHPHLGYQLHWGNPKQPSPPLWDALLNHVDVLNKLSPLAIGDAYLAAEAGDANRVMADIRSSLQMAAHCDPPDAFLVEQLVALRLTDKTLLLIDRLVERHPELFSDEQLLELTRIVSSHLGGDRFHADFTFELCNVLAVIQRTFSEDSEGDGVLTLHGMRVLQSIVPSIGYAARSHTTLGSIRIERVPDVASRQEQTRMAKDFFADAESSVAPPPWKWTRNPDVFLLQEPARQARGREFFPSFTFLPLVGKAQQRYELTTQRRDATLVVLALELYRRRHGDWPQSLTDLTPGLLPEVPVDRCDGQPLRYLLREGRPVLYSLGANFADEGGLPGGEEAEVPNFFEREKVLRGELPAESADWVLFPPRPPKPTAPVE